jgi:hypothetical protein
VTGSMDSSRTASWVIGPASSGPLLLALAPVWFRRLVPYRRRSELLSVSPFDGQELPQRQVGALSPNASPRNSRTMLQRSLPVSLVDSASPAQQETPSSGRGKGPAPPNPATRGAS